MRRRATRIGLKLRGAEGERACTCRGVGRAGRGQRIVRRGVEEGAEQDAWRGNREVKCAVRAWRTRVRNFQEHMPCVCRWARGDDSVRLPGAVRSPPAWQRFGVTASVLVLVLPPATGECLSFWTLVNLQLPPVAEQGEEGERRAKC